MPLSLCYSAFSSFSELSVNEEVEKVFRLIRFAADKADISKKQKRALYLKLCEKAVEQVTFNAATQKELRKLTDLEEEEEQAE